MGYYLNDIISFNLLNDIILHYIYIIYAMLINVTHRSKLYNIALGFMMLGVRFLVDMTAIILSNM